MKRRILDELVMTEISGVDRPCQEGARVAIMKRAEDEFAGLGHLEYRIAMLKNQVDDLEKNWSVAARLAAAAARRAHHAITSGRFQAMGIREGAARGFKRHGLKGVISGARRGRDKGRVFGMAANWLRDRS